jgi:hypothetical protein
MPPFGCPLVPCYIPIVCVLAGKDKISWCALLFGQANQAPGRFTYIGNLEQPISTILNYYLGGLYYTDAGSEPIDHQFVHRSERRGLWW